VFNALKKVGIAASPEGGKPILTGVYFDNEEKQTNLVSTDSYRLATTTVSDLPINDAGIVSFRSLNETIKLFEEEEEININSTERELHFYNERYYTSVRKLEGKFPEYKALFPKENLFSLEVDKKTILDSLDRSTVVAEGFIPVSLKVIDENNLHIYSTNKDIGGGVEEVDINILGLDVGDVSNFEISFNPNYLIQGIEVLEGSKVYLRFSGNDKPAVIQGEEEKYKYLLMPVRTNQ
jgi:DNA polymerase-3 subunit beta